jgi:hypothetical protein
MTNDDEQTISETVEPLYQLSLKGKGITVEQEVPQGVAREIIALVMGGLAPVGAPVARPGVTLGRAGAHGGGMVSVRQYLDDADATKNPEIITAIGEYLRLYANQERFTRADVRARFSQAGERTPSNLPRDWALAVGSDWIAPDHADSGRFYVTENGRKAIASKFENAKIRRPRRRSGKKTTAKTDDES